jgi:histidinol-phosphate aminotransferase
MQLPVEQIEKILISNPDSVVLIDEAYVDFGGESCYPLIGKYENLLVVRTFSKSRCLAGARLGYAIGSKQLIDDLEKIKYSTNPYNVNRMTLRVGEATVDAEPYYQDLCREIIRVRESTKDRLEAMGFCVLPSKTNFLFAMCPGKEGKWLYENLKSKGILVRHFEKPRIHPYIRITIGSYEQMEQFLSVINELIQEDAT